MTYTFKLSIPFSKNNISQFKRLSLKEIKKQIKPIKTLTGCCYVKVLYSPSDKKKKDIIFIQKILYSLFKSAKLIKNISLIKQVSFLELNETEYPFVFHIQIGLINYWS